MTAPQYEPRTMKHPHAHKGAIQKIDGIDPVSGRKFTDYQGEPDTFPDVVVKDPTTEEFYRARGYIVPGEVPPPPAEYAEYPVMLVHPAHVDAVPDDFTVEKGPNGEIIRHRIPGIPEKFPPQQADNPEQEVALGKQGYARAGQDNPDAIRTAKASPYKPGQKIEEFPKMVDGKIVDPNEQVGGPIQYPKWVGDRIVNSRAEEEALTGKQVDAVIDTCIICDQIILASEPRGEGKNGLYHLAHLQAIDAAPANIQAQQAEVEEIKAGVTKPRRGRPPGPGKAKPTPEA